jgi:hypothetical protein
VVFLCHTGDIAPMTRSNKHLWNFSKLLPVYTTLQPRRQPSSYSPLGNLISCLMSLKFLVLEQYSSLTRITGLSLVWSNKPSKMLGHWTNICCWMEPDVRQDHIAPAGDPRSRYA